MNSIADFYKDSVVFVTGGTGFLGKLVIEKLLRSCPEIEVIYVLIRSIKGKTVEERFKEFVKGAAFGKVQNEVHKLVPIEGDIADSNLKLSEEDFNLLKDEVQIVFHVAANVKFNQDLKTEALFNTFGTKYVFNLCKLMKRLKSVVHVSTALLNHTGCILEEKVYPASTLINRDDLLNVIQYVPSNLLNILAKEFQKPHPNTYTLTKALAEEVVEDYEKFFPIAVVRPSIVANAFKEPFPGWVDGLLAPTVVLCETMKGTLCSLMCDSKAMSTFIPADIVVNTIITAAWANKRNFENGQRFTIYNCTPFGENAISNDQQRLLTLKWARVFPPKSVVQYPNLWYHGNKTLHWFLLATRQMPLGFLADCQLIYQGKRPFMSKFMENLKAFSEVTEPFLNKSFRFSNKNLESLISFVNAADDGKEFDCDVGRVDWDVYYKNAVLGHRKFTLKEREHNLEDARKKLKKFNYILYNAKKEEG